MYDTFHKDGFYRLTEENKLTIRVYERIQCGLSHADSAEILILILISGAGDISVGKGACCSSIRT